MCSDAFEVELGEVLGELNPIETRHAPPRLFCLGDVSLLQRAPRISIVGSRKASQDGLRRALKLARRLVDRDAVVVSGMAEGIDTIAHTAAMEAGGKTIAVLGTPLDKPYPKSNLSLFNRICDGHLAVTQFAIGRPTHPRDFPVRNRTMALLSHATVIVEAKDDSGSLHQAWEALRLGRPLFFAASMLKSDLKWPAELQRYGAEVLDDATLDELFERLPAGQHEQAFVL